MEANRELKFILFFYFIICSFIEFNQAKNNQKSIK